MITDYYQYIQIGNSASSQNYMLITHFSVVDGQCRHCANVQQELVEITEIPLNMCIKYLHFR